MSGSELEVADYRRLFKVLERFESVGTLREFREVLPDAFGSGFGVRGVGMVTGDTVTGMFRDPDPLVEGVSRSAIEEYRERWFDQTVFAAPDAVSALASTRAVSLTEIRRVPGSAGSRFVEEYLFRHGAGSAGAVHLDLAHGRHALISIYGCAPHYLSPRDMAVLRLLARQLNLITRQLSAGPSPSLWAELTPRQREVARLVAEGFSNAAIGRALSLTEDTVKKYVSRILARTGCVNRTELAHALSTFVHSPGDRHAG